MTGPISKSQQAAPCIRVCDRDGSSLSLNRRPWRDRGCNESGSQLGEAERVVELGIGTAGLKSACSRTVRWSSSGCHPPTSSATCPMNRCSVRRSRPIADHHPPQWRMVVSVCRRDICQFSVSVSMKGISTRPSVLRRAMADRHVIIVGHGELLPHFGQKTFWAIASGPSIFSSDNWSVKKRDEWHQLSFLRPWSD